MAERTSVPAGSSSRQPGTHRRRDDATALRQLSRSAPAAAHPGSAAAALPARISIGAASWRLPHTGSTAGAVLSRAAAASRSVPRCAASDGSGAVQGRHGRMASVVLHRRVRRTPLLPRQTQRGVIYAVTFAASFLLSFVFIGLLGFIALFILWVV